MARRLIEAGVKFVEVTLDGWDTHVDNFHGVKNLLADLDPAMATLFKELAERDRLDDTLVIWMGEFGRSPKINHVEGRDHHPAAWSAVLAGGGVRGGQVYGATDDEGAKVADRPGHRAELFRHAGQTAGHRPGPRTDEPRRPADRHLRRRQADRALIAG